MAFKKRYVVSDESINCFGFWILVQGIMLEQAKLNCPAFYNHETWDIPLGHWENFSINKNGELEADLIIEGANEREKEFIRKIQNGDIKGASIGADPLVWSEDPTLLKQGQQGPTLIKCDLFEISITPLPGNKNALALKHKGSLITLSSLNQNDIVPNLKPKQNMKDLAIKLGLPADATEAQIMAAVIALQLTAATVTNYQKAIADVADGLDEVSADVFVNLSKTEPEKAVKFYKSELAKKAPAAETTDEQTPEEPVQLTQTPGKKPLSVSGLIKPGKNANGTTPAGDEDKECFDYLQRKNPTELARIRKEEPAKYTQLAKAYGEGKRYAGK